jgi:hypothetical protein
MTREELTPQDKFDIAQRDDFTCQYCGGRPGNDKLHIDHLIPYSKRGSNNPENLVTSCEKCNVGKLARFYIPKSLCVGPDTLDPEWTIYKAWGAWGIKWHPEEGVVLEYTPFESSLRFAPISHTRAYSDWYEHIGNKSWPEPHCFINFSEALQHLQMMVRPPKGA